MSFSLGSIYHTVSAELAKLVGGHQAAINNDVTIAQNVASAGAVMLAVCNYPAAAAEVKKVSDALSVVDTTATTLADSTTLTQQATAIGNAVVTLANNGDINVKNANTQATITAVVQKATAAIGTLETAAQATAPAAPSQS